MGSSAGMATYGAGAATAICSVFTAMGSAAGTAAYGAGAATC